MSEVPLYPIRGESAHRSYCRAIGTCLGPLEGQILPSGHLMDTLETRLFRGGDPTSRGIPFPHYRGTSLIRKRHPLGPCGRTVPRDIWWP